MRSYPETLAFLFSRLPMYQRIGAAAYKADLKTTVHLASKLGHPEQTFPSVHIAGTNGKGSVAHMTASVLQEAGYKTGLYTSPHLKDFRERIRINGKLLPESFVIQFVDQYEDQLEKIQPSFFEYTFGMAMHYFAMEKVDIAVVETGMGGRLDSTNIVRPVLTVITNIGLDHTRFLGDTLAKIAQEKAGIMKPGVPAVIGESQEETDPVFLETSGKLKIPLVFADREIRLDPPESGKNQEEQTIHVDFSGKNRLTDVPFPFLASYQIKNLRTVLVSLKILQDSGWKIHENHIRSGIRDVVKNTGLAGRWQILDNAPLTICDSGHNQDGIREVVSQINKLTYDTLHFVLGVVEDKQLDNLLTLLPCEAVYYFCKAGIPRGLDARTLRDAALQSGLKGEVYGSVYEAFLAAKHNASDNDLVFIGGSTFVVAEIL